MSLRTKRAMIQYKVIDVVDIVYRLFTRQMYLPPYSLREFVGGAKGFKDVGPSFLNYFKQIGVLNANTNKILDIGCGSGRLAYTLAMDNEIKKQKISYVGMDVDSKCIRWCNKNIKKRNPNFDFYSVDLYSKTYNPKGKIKDSEYQFPFENNSFDLIILTSVFTHMLEPGLTNYTREIARLLTNNGVAYVTCFLYASKEEAIQGVERRSNLFPHYFETYSLADIDFPENAVAYSEKYIKDIFLNAKLANWSSPCYGVQDLFLLKKA